MISELIARDELNKQKNTLKSLPENLFYSM